jgi:hypothetical protein
MRASVWGSAGGNWLHFSAKVAILPGFTPNRQPGQAMHDLN